VLQKHTGGGLGSAHADDAGSEDGAVFDHDRSDESNCSDGEENEGGAAAGGIHYNVVDAGGRGGLGEHVRP